MIRKDGTDYDTIAEAAKILGVSAKTVREYIDKRIISEPPTIDYGVRTVMYFPADYMRAAKTHIDLHRKKAAAKSKRVTK